MSEQLAWDTAARSSALADSLRRHLRAELYGAAPLVVFRAGEQPAVLSLSSSARLEGLAGADPGALRLAPGELARVHMPDGAESIGLGDAIPVRAGDEVFLLAELTVHSTAWRKALGGPVDDPLLTIWIE